MSEAEWRALGEYIRWLADGIGLRDWFFHVNHEPTEDHADEDVCAQINVTYARRDAVIRVCHNFRNLDLETQRMCILHELLHCHMEACDEVIRDDLYASRALSEVHYQSVKRAHHRAEEQAVDAITMAIAEHFPLIEWPKTEEGRK